MATRTTYNILTGNDKRLRLQFYYSPHFGQNIIRRGSSLTGERTKNDPAFKGFRQSINRMKEASPIAASLYKLLPEQVRQYSLYRTLTGEAIKLLKEEKETVFITESLKKKYIDPLLYLSQNNSLGRTVKEPVQDRVCGMIDFTRYTPGSSGTRRIQSRRRSRILQRTNEERATARHAPSTVMVPLPRKEINMAVSTNVPKESLKDVKRNKTTDGLVYLGRLPECKKLKIWVRSSMV
jgi:hypothetical protein